MERRTIRVVTLEDISKEVDRLHSNGYQQAGAWNLSQICEHLADWMTFPIDGFPKVPFVIGLILGLMRVTSGKKMLKTILAENGMRPGSPTIEQTVHLPGGDEAASVNRLKKAVERLIHHRGETHASPLFGKLTREQLIALQLVHCTHHLSFLIPSETAGS